MVCKAQVIIKETGACAQVHATPRDVVKQSNPKVIDALKQVLIKIGRSPYIL